MIANIYNVFPTIIGRWTISKLNILSNNGKGISC